jgi:hypothetical protein
MNYETFLENIVNDADEPTTWNHKSCLTFKDWTHANDDKKVKEEEVKKPVRKKVEKEVSKNV